MTFPLPTLNLKALSELVLPSNTCERTQRCQDHMIRSIVVLVGLEYSFSYPLERKCSRGGRSRLTFPIVLFSNIHPVYFTSTESPLAKLWEEEIEKLNLDSGNSNPGILHFHVGTCDVLVGCLSLNVLVINFIWSVLYHT